MQDQPTDFESATPPRSITRQGVVLVGLISLSVTLSIAITWRPDNQVITLVGLVASIALPMLFLEAYLNRAELFPVGLMARARANTRFDRLGIKLAALAATFAAIGLAYWAFPIYREGEAVIVWSILEIVGLPLLFLSPVYIWLTDVTMEEPEDGMFNAGLAVLGRWPIVDQQQLSQYVLGWLVKAFFAPLMLSYTIIDLNWLLSPSALALIHERPYGWYQFGYRFLFFIDLTFCIAGYFFTLRLFNTHIRSTDRTALGWAVCLACYPPFWYMIRSEYLAYWDVDWPGWFGNYPWFGMVWAGTILLLALIVVWSDVSFGLRFSNIAYRGLLTNGPYRWTKHPGYLAKNIHWWLISVPFLTHGSPLNAARHCLLLGLVNAIYYGRAKTEEVHLLAFDPEYRSYVDFIKRHGFFALCKRGLQRVAALGSAKQA